MLAEWMHDFESLEAISQDDDTRRLLLRMAALSQDGRLAPLLLELAHDDELDDEMKGTLGRGRRVVPARRAGVHPPHAGTALDARLQSAIPGD